jgi:hypothetical protein
MVILLKHANQRKYPPVLKLGRHTSLYLPVRTQNITLPYILYYSEEVFLQQDGMSHARTDQPVVCRPKLVSCRWKSFALLSRVTKTGEH